MCLHRKLKHRACFSSKELSIICEESGKGMVAVDVGADDVNVPFHNYKEFLGESFVGTIRK